jgi:hypothetical protein
MEPEGSLPCSQEHSTGQYLEPDQSSLYHLISSKIHFNIILPPASMSSYRSLSSWLSHQNPICIPLPVCTLCWTLPIFWRIFGISISSGSCYIVLRSKCGTVCFLFWQVWMGPRQDDPNPLTYNFWENDMSITATETLSLPFVDDILLKVQLSLTVTHNSTKKSPWQAVMYKMI